MKSLNIAVLGFDGQIRMPIVACAVLGYFAKSETYGSVEFAVDYIRFEEWTGTFCDDVDGFKIVDACSLAFETLIDGEDTDLVIETSSQFIQIVDKFSYRIVPESRFDFSQYHVVISAGVDPIDVRRADELNKVDAISNLFKNSELEGVEVQFIQFHDLFRATESCFKKVWDTLDKILSSSTQPLKTSPSQTQEDNLFDESFVDEFDLGISADIEALDSVLRQGASIFIGKKMTPMNQFLLKCLLQGIFCNLPEVSEAYASLEKGEYYKD